MQSKLKYRLHLLAGKENDISTEKNPRSKRLKQHFSQKWIDLCREKTREAFSFTRKLWVASFKLIKNQIQLA